LATVPSCGTVTGETSLLKPSVFGAYLAGMCVSATEHLSLTVQWLGAWTGRCPTLRLCPKGIQSPQRHFRLNQLIAISHGSPKCHVVCFSPTLKFPL
jgi:hypothetical protein